MKVLQNKGCRHKPDLESGGIKKFIAIKVLSTNFYFAFSYDGDRPDKLAGTQNSVSRLMK
ncbi:MAG: hypothetical protein IPJ09_02370 [Saprospiraceae bacterium]|nr:hypothetical protein [Saprospiraceae bacterium]